MLNYSTDTVNFKASSICISNSDEMKKEMNTFEAQITNIQSDKELTRIALSLKNMDKIWLTCKSHLLSEVKLHVEKNILIGK